MDTSKYEDLFISEAEEYIEQISNALLTLEREPENADAISSIFRAMHTLKGMSASMGYVGIAQLAHALEDVMDMIRNGKLKMYNELIDLLLKGNDYIGMLVHKQNVNEDVLKSYRNVLSSLKASNADASIEKKSNEDAKPEVKLPSTAQLDIIFVDDVILKSARAFVVIKMLQDFNILSGTSPSNDKIMKEEFDKSFTVFLTTDKDIDKVIEQIKNVPEIRDVVRSVKKEEVLESDTLSQQKKDIKVSLDRLDNLQNFASELVIARGRLQQIAYQLQNEDLINALNSTSKIVTNIQDEVMKIRMVPVWQLFDRYPRYVRDLASKLNKKINFVVKGRDIELDRSLLNSLADPLLHLLRNSIDHGVETPEERSKKGKNPTGTVTIEAKRLKNAVVIEVSDDGKGLDRDKILSKAIEKGLITEDNARMLTKNEIHHFITENGFSTKDEVSDISGRGVGVDAVKSVLKSIGGTFEIESEKDEGTIFKMKVPLTLAIIKTLQVKVGKETYIAPLTHIIETIDIKEKDIQSIMNREIFILRDEIIPIIRISDTFKVNMERSKDEYSIVLVDVEESTYGILVDEFVEQSEVVVKSLKGLLSGIQGLAGVTILNDGQPSFIIDVPGILQMAKVG